MDRQSAGSRIPTKTKEKQAQSNTAFVEGLEIPGTGRLLSPSLQYTRAKAGRTKFRRRFRRLLLASGGCSAAGGDEETRNRCLVYIPPPFSLCLGRLGLGLLPAAAAACELCCFLAFAFGSGWDAAGEHKRIACFLWIGGLAPSDADPQRILTLQSFFGNLWRCVLLLYCCGFASPRDGLCFFSGIGGGSNMRLVPGSACLVGAAQPPWNKLP